MLHRPIGILIMLISIISPLIWIGTARPVVLQATSELMTGAMVTEVDPLSFGKFTVGSAGGSIAISARSGDQVVTSGEVYLVGNEKQRGVVDVMAPPGAEVIVYVNDATLTNFVTGETMRVSDVSCAHGSAPRIRTCAFTMNPGWHAEVGVGGKLTILPHLTPGLYQGFIVVTASFQ